MIEIELKVDIKDIRNFYFQGNQHKHFFGPETKKQSAFLVFSIAVFPFFLFSALKGGKVLYLALGCVFFSYLVYEYWKAAKPIIAWKKSVLKFLEEAEKVQVLRFHYNDDYFIHIQDDSEIKQEWNAVDHALIRDRFIGLYFNTSVFLPKSSMKENEFGQLLKMVLKKIKNVEKQ